MNNKSRTGLAALLLACAPGAFASPCAMETQNASTISTASTSPMRLVDIINTVRQSSPAIRIAALERLAAQANAAQAERWANPSMGFEIEDFGGTRSLGGLDQSEQTLAYSQPFELGGKRTKRIDAANARSALATANCDLIQRETELQASLGYVELPTAQALHHLALESLDLAKQLQDKAARRVDAGAAAPPELSRARSDRARLEAQAIGLEAQIERERANLAQFWGGRTVILAEETSSFLSVSDSPQPPLKTIHPTVLQAQAMVKAAEADARYERSNSAPDLDLTLGVKHFEATDEQALIAGVAITLPLFDRNQDNARASDYRAQGARIRR